jgi:chemotaxis protein MotB
MRSIPLAAALVLSGCVTQSTFDALRAENDQTSEHLTERNKQLRDAEAKIAALATQGKSLEAALASEKEKVDDSNLRIARLMAEMASASKDKNKLQSSIEEMTIAISDLEKRRAAAEARVNEFKSLLAKFKSLIDAGKLKVRIVDGRMVVVLATDILFGSGSANLSKDGKLALAEVAQVLASIEKRSFQVEGHTDNVPIATAQYPSNWELASARAINVLKSMVESGLPTGRVSAASFGDSRPSVGNDSVEGKAQNRRIEIIIVPDLSGLPGFDELQKAEKSG